MDAGEEQAIKFPQVAGLRGLVLFLSPCTIPIAEVPTGMVCALLAHGFSGPREAKTRAGPFTNSEIPQAVSDLD